MKFLMFDKRHSETLWNILAFSIGIGTLIAMIIRAFFGTELTDEAYYVSCAISILKGNVPIAYNNDSMSFFAYVLLVPQLWIYEKIVPNFEGVFLFTRVSFLVFKSLLLLCLIRMLKRETSPIIKYICFALMISYAGGNITNNYSYNSISPLLALTIGVSLFNIIEKHNKYKAIYLLILGILSAWLVFIHNGYAVAILWFIILIIIRSKNKYKLINTLFYGIGGLVGILVIFIPIMIETDVLTFYKGFYRLVFPYPQHPMSVETWKDRVYTVIAFVNYYIIIFGAIFCVSLFSLRYYIKKTGKEINIRQTVCISSECAYIVCLLVLVFLCGVSEIQMRLGILAAGYILLLFLCGALHNGSIVYYISVYQILFAGGMAILTGSNFSPTRFIAVIPGIIGICIVLSKSNIKIIRLLNYVILFLVTIIVGYSQYKYVYRDDCLPELTTCVESGVYKGIYTTPTRANDLPEIEQYLNEVVRSGDTYACRDNVPFAYLMIHDGTMVEINTWDSFQYSYNLNEPAKMYAYYERRDMIPEKIIYIDFGRDDNLSIEDDNFRYNDWVDEYYSKNGDVVLNETFFHVIDYQYNGGFDGNYEYWIEKYKGLAE